MILSYTLILPMS